jgi:hypothetical protein
VPGNLEASEIASIPKTAVLKLALVKTVSFKVWQE